MCVVFQTVIKFFNDTGGYMRYVTVFFLTAVLFAFPLFFSDTIAQSLRFTFFDDAGDTVLDYKTGLLWQKSHSSTTYYWREALAYCEALSVTINKNQSPITITNWRLPDIKELRSIIDTSYYNPAIDSNFFPSTSTSYFYSSTTKIVNDYQFGDAWTVSFQTGQTSWADKDYNKYYARCVTQPPALAQ